VIQLLGAFSLLMSLSTAGLFYLYDGEKEERIKVEAALGQVSQLVGPKLKDCVDSI
jgi:hypothetical protein